MTFHLYFALHTLLLPALLFSFFFHPGAVVPRIFHLYQISDLVRVQRNRVRLIQSCNGQAVVIALAHARDPNEQDRVYQPLSCDATFLGRVTETCHLFLPLVCSLFFNTEKINTTTLLPTPDFLTFIRSFFVFFLLQPLYSAISHFPIIILPLFCRNFCSSSCKTPPACPASYPAWRFLPLLQTFTCVCITFFFLFLTLLLQKAILCFNRRSLDCFRHLEGYYKRQCENSQSPPLERVSCSLCDF